MAARWGCRGALFSVGAALWACNWAELEAIRVQPAASDAEPSVVDATSNPEGLPDSDLSVDEASFVEAAASSACTTDETVVNQWMFDANTENWALSTDTGLQGSLTWTSATGYPSPGALEVDVTPGVGDVANSDGAWLQYDTPLGNLSGRTVSAWVWLDSGPTPHFKLFVQTGAQWVWADNGTVSLTPHTWTCVSLPVSSPSYNGDNYDPTDVVRLGFEMLDSEPFRLYVDSVRYY